MEDLKNQIEALLFASGKFMSEENLSLIIGVEKKDVKKAIKDLVQTYEERDHSLLITQEADTWKINVREKYLDLVRKIVADTELPKSVLETLAVIAWKSPVLQSDIVKIRGNKCYEHIAQLEEMGFITKISEGRSYIVKVTEKFFDYFDVEGDKNLKEVFKEVKIPIKDDPQQSLNAVSDDSENTDISELEPKEDGEDKESMPESFTKAEQELEEKEEALENAVDTRELKAELPEDVLEEEANTGDLVEGEGLNKDESDVLEDVVEEVEEELKAEEKTKPKKKKASKKK